MGSQGGSRLQILIHKSPKAHWNKAKVKPMPKGIDATARVLARSIQPLLRRRFYASSHPFLWNLRCVCYRPGRLGGRFLVGRCTGYLAPGPRFRERSQASHTKDKNTKCRTTFCPSRSTRPANNRAARTTNEGLLYSHCYSQRPA